MSMDPDRLRALLDAAVPTVPTAPAHRNRAQQVLARGRREHRRRAAATSAGGVLVLLAVPLALGWLGGGNGQRLLPAAPAGPAVNDSGDESAIGRPYAPIAPSGTAGSASPPAATPPEPTATGGSGTGEAGTGVAGTAGPGVAAVPVASDTGAPVAGGLGTGAPGATAGPAAGPAAPVAGYADTVRADRPVAYWRLDDPPGPSRSAAETVGGAGGGFTGGYGGLTDGPVRGVPGATGDGNTAARFDGALDTVSVTSGPALATGDRFTIEAWVQRTQLGNGSSGHGQVIVGKGNDSALLTFVDDRLTLDVYAVGVVAAATVSTTDLGVWHHVAATKNGPEAHLFIDGVDVTGPVTDHTVRDRGTPLQIGGDGFSGSPAAAVIDEVAIYATALPAERIRAHVAAR